MDWQEADESSLEWYEEHHALRQFYDSDLVEIEEMIEEARVLGADVEPLIDRYLDFVADLRRALVLVDRHPLPPSRSRQAR